MESVRDLGMDSFLWQSSDKHIPPYSTNVWILLLIVNLGDCSLLYHCVVSGYSIVYNIVADVDINSPNTNNLCAGNPLVDNSLISSLLAAWQ